MQRTGQASRNPFLPPTPLPKPTPPGTPAVTTQLPTGAMIDPRMWDLWPALHLAAARKEDGWRSVQPPTGGHSASIPHSEAPTPAAGAESAGLGEAVASEPWTSTLGNSMQVFLLWEICGDEKRSSKWSCSLGLSANLEGSGEQAGLAFQERRKCQSVSLWVGAPRPHRDHPAARPPGDVLSRSQAATQPCRARNIKAHAEGRRQESDLLPASGSSNPLRLHRTTENCRLIAP